jgi:hypothetical protein
MVRGWMDGSGGCVLIDRFEFGVGGALLVDGGSGWVGGKSRLQHPAMRLKPTGQPAAADLPPTRTAVGRSEKKIKQPPHRQSGPQISSGLL